MESGALFLRDIIIVLLVGFIGGFIAKKLRLPTLLGYLLAGFLFTVIVSTHFTLGTQVETLSDIGVAFLMFTIGVGFTVRHLQQVKFIAVFGTIFQIIFTLLISSLLLPYLGFSLQESIFLGSVVALSSTTIVVKILTEKGQLETLHGQILVGMLLVQDLAVIPLLVILPPIVSSQALTIMTFIPIILSLIKASILIFLTMYLGKNVVPFTLQKVARSNSRELLLLIVVLIALGFAFIASLAGFPAPIGAFLAGILISETTIHHAVFTEIRPLRDIFSIIFFVLLGMLLSPMYFFTHITSILLLFVFTLLVKLILSYTIVRLHHYHSKTAFQVANAMTSVGEFAFVVGGIFVVEGYISTDLYNLLLSTTLLTLLVAPWQIQQTSRIYKLLKKYHLIFADAEAEQSEEVSLLDNHVILLGHGRIGGRIAKELEKEKIPFVGVDFNLLIVEQLKRKGIPVIYGDPSDSDILKAANIEKAKAVVITVPDVQTQEVIMSNIRKLNSKVTIITRSHNEADTTHLEKKGAHLVIQPEVEAGRVMGEKIKKLFE